MDDTGETVLWGPESQFYALYFSFLPSYFFTDSTQQLDLVFSTFSKSVSVELKLNLSTGWNQPYSSLVQASECFKYTTDAIISAGFTTIIYRQPCTVRQLRLHIFPFLFMKGKNTSGLEIFDFRCVFSCMRSSNGAFLKRSLSPCWHWGQHRPSCVTARVPWGHVGQERV